MVKKLLLFTYGCLLAVQLQSQYTIYEVGKVIYFDSHDSRKSKFLHQAAIRCNQYIQQYYPNQDTLTVRLDIRWTADTSIYQLGYDNLAGNFLELPEEGLFSKASASIAAKASKYPGIRIQVHHTTIQEADILKLLEYGLMHFSEIKRLTLYAKKQNYFERPSQVSVNPVVLQNILTAPASAEVQSILDSTRLKPADITVPSTIDEALKQMLLRMDNFEKNYMRSLNEGSVVGEFLYAGHDPHFYINWHLQDRNESPLVVYFAEHNITDSYDAYEVLLRACHKRLNGLLVNVDQIMQDIVKQRENYKREYTLRMTSDSLHGIYIPKDLLDCFAQLDRLLTKEDRQQIKSLRDKSEASKECNGNLGKLIRTNWGLWGGSRLQKYFMERSIDRPENMSAVILEYYYEWLNEKNVYMQNWVSGK